jgi:hypothetical protein
VLLLRMFGLTVRGVAKAVPSSTRAALFVAYGVAVASAVALLIVFTAFLRILVVPFALGDSFGHPSVVSDFEHRLEESPGDDLRYVTAVANHYAGNHTRAAQLYAGVPSRDGLAANLAAARAHTPPVHAITSDDLYNAYTGEVWSRLVSTFGADDLGSETESLLALLVLLAIPLVPLLTFRAGARESANEEPSRLRRISALVTPGFSWAVGGAPWFGWLAALSFAIALPPFIAALRGAEYWSGVAKWLVFYDEAGLTSMLGLPPNSGSFVDRFAVGLAYPHARWWYSIFTIAAVLFVILQVGGIARAFAKHEPHEDSLDDATALMER